MTTSPEKPARPAEPSAPSENKESLLTPFNVVAGILIIGGVLLALLRFTKGLGALGDPLALDSANSQPWGVFIGFNLLCGVPLSAGGFVIGTAVYIFGMKEYKPVVRPAVLVGFMGYAFVVIALLIDVGRPWRLPYPMVVSYGVTSVLFLVGWHVALYLSTQFVEFSPAIVEWIDESGRKKEIIRPIIRSLFRWIDWKWLHKVAVAVTIGATIFGVILSTLHQSALGGLFLITPTKVHPLWYSPFIPLFFFVSAIAGGLCMVIFESSLASRVFGSRVEVSDEQLTTITLGLGKAASITLAVYLAIKVVGIAHANTWHYLATPLGHWFLVELLGFVLVPCLLFATGFREKRVGLIRFTAVLTIIGIVINRLNVAIIAFNWTLPSEQRFHVHWMEIWLSVSVITTGLVVYRWIVSRMPVWNKHPKYKGTH